MIKKHPGLIGLSRPSFMSRTHICEYHDKLYEISRMIYNIKEYTIDFSFTFKYITSFIKEISIILSHEDINKIKNIQINKNEHIIDTCTIYISKEYMFNKDYIQETILEKLIYAFSILLKNDINIDDNTKEEYLYNLLYRGDIDFKQISKLFYYRVDILNILGNLLNYICEDSYKFSDYLYGSIRYIHKRYNDIDNIKMLRRKYTYHEIKKLMDDEVSIRINAIKREYKKIYDYINYINEPHIFSSLYQCDKELENIYKIIYNVNTTKQFIENIKNRIDIFLNKTLPDIQIKEYEKSNLKKLFDKFEYKKVEYYT